MYIRLVLKPIAGVYPANMSTLFQRFHLVDTLQFARKYAETVPFDKISTQGNLVKLRYFTQWLWRRTTSNQRWNNVSKINTSKTIQKKKVRIKTNGIHRIENFNYYFITFCFLLPMWRKICRRKLAKLRKFLKGHEKYCISRT